MCNTTITFAYKLADHNIVIRKLRLLNVPEFIIYAGWHHFCMNVNIELNFRLHNVDEDDNGGMLRAIVIFI